jgi:hypothetical protein
MVRYPLTLWPYGAVAGKVVVVAGGRAAASGIAIFTVVPEGASDVDSIRIPPRWAYRIR